MIATGKGFPMRRVRYSVATSLDGFIADRTGGHDWIVMDPEIDFAAVMSSFDTVIMGRKTYETAIASGRGAGMPGMTTLVVSRTLNQKDCPGVTVTNSVQEMIADLRQEPGKDLWLFGGGVLFSTMLDAGMVDSVELTIIPVLLGQGLSLAPGLQSPAKMKLATHRAYPKTGTVTLEYAVQE